MIIIQTLKNPFEAYSIRPWLVKLLAFVMLLLPLGFATAGDENLLKNDARSPAHIVVLGDSLSAGYKMQADKGWVSLLEKKLKGTHPNLKIVNASISGATTAAGLQQLPSLMEQYSPKLVILELGANDGLQGKPIPYITKNLQSLIELAKSGNSDVLLLGIKLPPNYGERYTKPFFEQFQMLADKNKLSLVPFMLEGVAGNDELMQADGLHPNEQAQTLILDLIYPILQSKLLEIEAEQGSAESAINTQ